MSGGRRRALLVANPAAGKRTARDGDLERCAAVLRDAGFDLALTETSAGGPTSAELARRAAREGYDACVVAGGDGTVAPAAAQLLGTDVAMGILPFGSFMNIANGLGIPLEPLAAARVIADGHRTRADAGEVNGKIFFETAGMGLDAELFGAARHWERGSWRRALRRVVRWATHSTYRVTVRVDGEEHVHRVMQVLVLNSPYYAWAIELDDRASMTDGILDVAVFPRMGRRDLVGGLIAAWRGRRLPGRPRFYRGARVTIAADEPVSIHADGTLAGGLPAEFVCRRGALTVFTPRP
jgi:diacylglycerol kinase family enzyme